MKFCPLCKSNLVSRPVDGAIRLACSSQHCKFVHWNNPIPVVAGLVRCNGQYILARNISWPQGMFSFITGFLESGESPESAILRETEEELGIKGHECKFIGHFALAKLNQLIVAFAVEADGNIKLNEEIAEIQLVSHSQLTTFDFGQLELTKMVVAHWLKNA